METVLFDQVLRYANDQLREGADQLACEEPLEIRIRGRAISITMRTPGHDDELAAGFLISEGIIQNPPDVLHIEPCDRNEDGNILNVRLAPEVTVDFASLTRHVFASSSCGLCGKATIDAIHNQFPSIESNIDIDAETLFKLPQIMRDSQLAFDRSGGLHAAAIFDASGRLVVLREDVGRHNAVDKVIGYCFLHGIFPLNQHILLVSGRTSFEILQKALAARFPIIAAISAPSSLAVEFARQSGQTLIGFLRQRAMNLYAHSYRVKIATAIQA